MVVWMLQQRASSRWSSAPKGEAREHATATVIKRCTYQSLTHPTQAHVIEAWLSYYIPSAELKQLLVSERPSSTAPRHNHRYALLRRLLPARLTSLPVQPQHHPSTADGAAHPSSSSSSAFLASTTGAAGMPPPPSSSSSRRSSSPSSSLSSSSLFEPSTSTP